MKLARRRDRVKKLCIAGSASVSFLSAVLALAASSTPLAFRPGWNMFSPAEDAELGKENAAQVEKQVPMFNDPPTVRYINAVGRRLATYAPYNRSDYVWQFQVIGSPDINAFALPGGYIFVNRGTIESAADEAQLAGVLAHEEGHVVMRHGTHQASERLLATAPLALLGGLLGQGGGLMGRLAQYGIGFGVESILLRNSRQMESQADAIGAYILYHAGYDPHAMAQFFTIIQQKYPQRTVQFFSDHPNPGDRIKAVDAEIPTLGPPLAKPTLDSPMFEAIKTRLKSFPPPPKTPPTTGRGGSL